ncbi:MAG: UbiA family prenyltransferase [Candidatus Heimdallarchaeota archaeon]
MFKEKFYGLLKLIRFGISLFGCIGLFVSGILARDLAWFQIEYLIAFFIVFVSGAGAFTINDYYDFEIDRVNNRKDRPLVTGMLTRNFALITAIVSLIIVILLSLLLNFAAMILTFISVPVFYIYSLGLKKVLFFKNILIAYSYLSTIFLGSLIIDSSLEPLIIYFGIMGFIVGLANEIMFDIADVKGDEEQGINTLSTKYGNKTAAKFSVILYIIIMILDPLPFIINIDSSLYLDYEFFILILVPVISYIFLSRSLIKNQTTKNVLKLKTYVFLIMLFGTITYLVGVLI